MRTIRASLAAIGLAAASASTAGAATIDFTGAPFLLDNSVLSGTTGFGVGFTVSATGGAPNWTSFDGDVTPAGLAGQFDGVGVGDDEVSDTVATGETLIVTFDSAVRVHGLSFLDLFIDPQANPADNEAAIVDFTNGSALKTFNGVEEPDGSPGFLAVTFAPETTSKLILSASVGNDGRGDGDFALAAIDVKPVPLPAAAWMLISAVAGMGFLARKRRAA